MIHYYIFVIQLMYFNTIIHIYKQIFMFLKTLTALERIAKGNTLVSSPSIQSHNLTPTLTITYIYHLPWSGVGVKLTFS